MNVFTHVTFRTLRKNRTRTAVTIIGIILATAMLTAVTSFVSSLQHFMVESVIAEDGNWHGAMFQIPAEKLQEIAERKEVEALSSCQELGYARIPETDEDNIEKPYLFVAGAEGSFFEMLSVRPVKGRLPENSREIAVPHYLLTQARMDIKIGDTLTLNLGERYFQGQQLGNYNPPEFTEDEKELAEELILRETRTYTVVGVIEMLAVEDYRGAAYYCVTRADETPAEDGTFTCLFRMRHPSRVYDFVEEAGGGYGALFNSTLLRYLGVSTNRPFLNMLYGLAAVLIVLIMTGGISLVYNSFAISVSDRTKQFGLLASTGATPRQLRRMVIGEALLVSTVGIPLGVFCGLLGIGITLHFTESTFTYLYNGMIRMSLHVSWPAVLLAAATAFLTVLISAWIPSRRAARVSPVEAIRQSRDIRVPKRAAKKRMFSYRLFGLEGMIAGKYFSRNKKQYRATVFSLFISIVLFISASSLSAYLRSSVTAVEETVGYDVSVYIWEEEEEEDSDVMEAVEAVRQMDGIDTLITTRNTNADIPVDPARVNGEYLEYLIRQREEAGSGEELYLEDGRLLLNGCGILVLEDKAYREYLEDQGMDAEKYLNPDQIRAVALNQIYGYIPSQERYRYYPILKEAGCELELLLTDFPAWKKAITESGESGEEIPRRQFQTSVSVTVDQFMEKAPMNLYAGWGGGLVLIFPETVYNALTGGSQRYEFPLGRTIYLTGDHVPITEKIEEMSLGGGWNSQISVYDWAQNHQAQKNMMLTLDVFTYGFIVLISLIAVANVFNTISTGVLLRRREFAVLSSVGMTPKGLRRMLNYECILYGCKALLYGIPVSFLVTWRIYRVVEDSMDTGFYIPAAGVLIAVCSVFLVVFATMVYSRSRLKNENVIDSIRQESL